MQRSPFAGELLAVGTQIPATTVAPLVAIANATGAASSSVHHHPSGDRRRDGLRSSAYNDTHPVCKWPSWMKSASKVFCKGNRQPAAFD